MTPLISVVLPVYNAVAFVGQAVTSILNQSFADFELIIVVDGSTDGSRDVVLEYARADTRIRMLELARVDGSNTSSRARNHGIAHAKGEFIAAQDHDDVSFPHRLATQLAYLQQHDLDVVGGQADVIGTQETHYWFPQSHDAIGVEMIFRPALFQTTKLARTRLMRNLPYSQGLIDDYDWLVRAMAAGARMGNVPETTTQYRLWPGQTSTADKAKMARDFRRARFQYCFATIPGLTNADFLLLDKMANRLPMHDAGELTRAGEWLVKLFNHNDPKFENRMQRRWAETCDLAGCAVDEALRTDISNRLRRIAA